MASQPIYKYERDDGTILYGLTMEQALEEEAKDKALRQQQETDAKLGPQIAAGIHAYESQQQQNSKGPQQPFQSMGNGNSSPMSAMSSSGPSQNTNPAPNVTVSRFGEDGFMEQVNSAVEQQKRETPSPFEGTPAFDSLSNSSSSRPMSAMQDTSGMPSWTPDKNGNMPQSYYQNQQASKDYAALTKGIPPEAMELLHARWRMGEFGKNPSNYYAELLKVRGIFDQVRKEQEKAEYQSKLRKDEEKNKAFFNTEDKILELDSQERRAADNNATQIKLEQMRINDEKEKNKGSLFGGLSGTYANSNDIEGTLINGLSTIPNTLISKESVNRAKTSYERYLDITRQLDNYEQMYAEAGTELVGSKAEAMNAAYRGIQMSLKELENLGVLNGQDLLIMQDMVPAISGVKATARSTLNPVLGDKIKSSMSQLKNRVATKVDANLQTNGFTRNDKQVKTKKENGGTTLGDPLGIR